jgi:hypothetical protein
MADLLRRTRPRRVAVFVTVAALFAAGFDLAVPHLWVDFPVEIAAGFVLELLFPTFGLSWLVGELRRLNRQLRQARRDIDALSRGEMPDAWKDDVR